MNQFTQSCRKFLRRHSEAIFIIAFLWVDLFVTGLPLTIGVVAAVLYVLAPAVATVRKLNAREQIAYLKAFVKTRRFQRLCFLLFALLSVRGLFSCTIDSKLFMLGDGSDAPVWLYTISKEQFPLLSTYGKPFPIYIAVCALAILIRSRLKATKKDPDLIRARQKWTLFTQFTLYAAFAGSILSITANPDGPAYMISNWLLASARDANVFDQKYLSSWAQGQIWGDSVSDKVVQYFDKTVITILSLSLAVGLFQPMQRMHSFLTSFCWRAISPTSIPNLIEAFIEAMRLKERNLALTERHPFISNSLRTIVWYLACYAGLFWLFGFNDGPVGYAIQSWMITAGVDAGYGTARPAPDFFFTDNYRIFLGSVVALYASAPLAVTAAVILPFAKARKITLNCDGISFFQGPFFSMLGRQSRLWTDLKELRLLNGKVQQANKSPVDLENTLLSHRNKPLEFILKFATGGSVGFSSKQMSAQDLSVLLESIDQHAINCKVDPEIYTLCREQESAKAADQAASDGLQATAIPMQFKPEFKSTVFVPFAQGDFLPKSKTRIIRQLASKPLCAVYLARDEDGKMLTVKQFYLADESEETKAFEKILHREYELLSKLDHPGIAKVSRAYSVDKSTFLLVEHRPGNDLREVVQEHGPRSETLVVNWAMQICEIMNYLHSREPVILHRDLTPDNIIAGEDGQLRLIDFGAAREFLEGITGTMIGKQCYVAPEQLRGVANTASDIYSFGCTLYYLLTGKDPKALSQSSAASLMDCSDELDQLIKDCTEFEAENRPQTFGEVLARLKKIKGGTWIKLNSERQKVPA